MEGLDEFSENIKDQLYLLALLVFFVGIVSTEEYYAAFSVRYQSLDLPVFHLVYRGMTAIYTNWPLLIVYAVTTLFLFYKNGIIAAIGRKSPILASALPYIFYVWVVTINFPLAIHYGKEAGRIDMSPESALPKILKISIKDNEALAKQLMEADTRFLVADRDYLVVFSTVKGDGAKAAPNIIRLEHRQVDILQTNAK